MRNWALRAKPPHTGCKMKNIVSRCQGAAFRNIMAEPWDGEIILVTHEGWYIETGNGQILLLHDAKYGEVPIGAALPDIKLLPYDKGLEHSSVHYESGLLSLLSGLSISFLPCEKHQAEAGVVSPQWLECLKTALAGHGKGVLRYTVCDELPRVDDHMTNVICQRVDALCQALKAKSPEAVSAAVRRMLGLGRGLTPGCDDWLVGYMYAAHRTGKIDRHRLVARAIEDCAAEYTTGISSAYLLAAARGEYYEVLERCLFDDDSACVEQLLEIGNSSGSDMLSGMIAACTD